jgi:hypothetical protein
MNCIVCKSLLENDGRLMKEYFVFNKIGKHKIHICKDCIPICAHHEKVPQYFRNECKFILKKIINIF